MTDESMKPYLMQAREAIAASSETSSVYVGCDSLRTKRHGKWMIRYSMVIVLHVDSNKGGKIFHDTIMEEDMTDKYIGKTMKGGKAEASLRTAALRARLMGEVNRSVDLVEAIIDVIGDRRLEVHLDLNSDEAHKSNMVVAEALGYVKAMTGYDAIVKTPMGDSWAATHVADHVVRR